MNKDFKGICLFLGMIGFAYAMMLVMVAVLTGAKIVKGIVFIATFSVMLISLGLTPQVKRRLVQVTRDKLSF